MAEQFTYHRFFYTQVFPFCRTLYAVFFSATRYDDGIGVIPLYKQGF